MQKYDDKIHVIQYISCTLGEDERKWDTRQKEALAIVWACEMFRVYVAGTHFIVESDHSSLEWLRKVQKPQRLVRWALRLEEFDFEIQHKPGRENGSADCLSRLPLSSNDFLRESLDFDERLYCNSISITGFEAKEISEAQLADPRLLSIIQEFKTSLTKTYGAFVYIDSILYNRDSFKCDRLVIPHSMREALLAQYHNHALSGADTARDKMSFLFKSRFYWYGMFRDIKPYIASNVLNINDFNHVTR